MFGFFNEICNKALVTEDFNLLSFRYINISNKIFYLEGMVKLLNFDKNNISIKTKKNTIVVSGENLKICEYLKEVILIKGKITLVEVL